jgi:hypothetical protein
MAKLSDPADIKREFRAVVNMTPSSLEKWLRSEESKSVGRDSGDGESVGHKSGKKIIRIKRKRAADLTDADLEHMRKVVGYVHRHLKQRPKNGKESRWRYSLMNWGHDPMKEKH